MWRVRSTYTAGEGSALIRSGGSARQRSEAGKAGRRGEYMRFGATAAALGLCRFRIVARRWGIGEGDVSTLRMA